MMIPALRRRHACLALFLSVTVPTVGAASIAPGDLVVTEFLANPRVLGDTVGEWVELFNTTNHAIDLRGLTIGDDGSDAHRITAPFPLSIPPGGYFVLGRSAVAGIGGHLADYVYDHFRLGNAADEIVLSDGGRVVWRLAYGAALAQAGRSAELVALTPTGGRYAPTPSSFGDGGDVGTPGRAGTLALAVAPVPLPSPALLFVSGLLGLLTVRRGRASAVRGTGPDRPARR